MEPFLTHAYCNTIAPCVYPPLSSYADEGAHMFCRFFVCVCVCVCVFDTHNCTLRVCTTLTIYAHMLRYVLPKCWSVREILVNCTHAFGTLYFHTNCQVLLLTFMLAGYGSRTCTQRRLWKGWWLGKFGGRTASSKFYTRGPACDAYKP